MVTFKEFFESIHNQQELTREIVLRGTGVELSDDQIKYLNKFPNLFGNKLAYKQIHLDPRYKESNRLFFEKIVSLVAACMGYGVQQGYRFPKTKIIAERLRSGSSVLHAGLHGHYRSRSWSHEIELVMDNIIPSVENLVSIIAHELAHSLQTTLRRLHTPQYPQPDFDIKWDKQKHKMVSIKQDMEKYRSQPWEIDAVEKQEEGAKYAIQYLRTGVAQGFNPAKV